MSERANEQAEEQTAQLQLKAFLHKRVLRRRRGNAEIGTLSNTFSRDLRSELVSKRTM